MFNWNAREKKNRTEKKKLLAVIIAEIIPNVMTDATQIQEA